MAPRGPFQKRHKLTCEWCGAEFMCSRRNAKTCSGLCSSKKHHLAKKGITPSGKRAALIAQEGKCAICGDQMSKVNADHCHATGRYRALLCTGCNLGLGSFRDSPDRLRTAAAYIDFFNARHK